MTSTIAPRAQNFRFYFYEPSMVAAVIFIILFATTTIIHAYQLVRSKTWFMIAFVIGGLFEMVGYVGRALSAAENPGPYGKIPYIIQSLLLLLAPLLFAASVYMELGRIVLMVEGESKLFIRRTWLTKIFVIGDVICFLVQAYGSGMLASQDPEKINIAHYIVIGGLCLQIAFFTFFVVAAAIFHIRLAKTPTKLALERPWTKHMIALYIVGAMILSRSIVRAVEFIQGFNGYIATHEAFLYVFDAVPMFVAVVTMNVINPGQVARYVRETAGGNKRGTYRKVDEEIPLV